MPSQHREPHRRRDTVVASGVAASAVLAASAPLTGTAARAAVALIAGLTLVATVGHRLSGLASLRGLRAHPLLVEAAIIGCSASAVVTLFAQREVASINALAFVTPAAGALVAHLLHVAVHELGHAAAGRMVGVRPLVVAVGPVVWTAGAKSSRLRWSRWTSFANGFVLVDHRRSCPTWRQQLIVLLGGPVASAGCCASGVMLVHMTWDSGAPALRAVAVGFGGMLALEGALQVVATVRMTSSDGRNMRHAVRTRHGAAAARQWLHPRAWPVPASPVEDLEFDQVMTGLYGAIARGDARAASVMRDRLVECVATLPPQIHGDVLTEAAFATALLDGAEEARPLLERAKRQGVRSPVLTARAEAAIALRQGSTHMALRAVERGLDHYGEDPRDTFWERDWLHELARQAEGRVSDFTAWFAHGAA